jgi:hypothetical protein
LIDLSLGHEPTADEHFGGVGTGGLTGPADFCAALVGPMAILKVAILKVAILKMAILTGIAAPCCSLETGVARAFCKSRPASCSRATAPFDIMAITVVAKIRYFIALLPLQKYGVSDESLMRALS